MNTKTLLKKINLSEQDFAEIKEVVKKAESKTSGEIALAFTAESAKYSFWELKGAIYFAAIVFALLLPFASKILHLYEARFWSQPVWFLPLIYGMTCLVALFLGFACANIPVIDRIVIPANVKKHTVTNRAFRHFAQSGIYNTKEHSGILIFVSYMERQVRILADSGISAKISQDLWNIIADDLASGIKAGKTKEGFIAAVEKCGELLQEHFPCGEENPNELPDGLVILEDSECL